MDKISKLDSNVIRGLLVAIVGLIGSVLHACGLDSSLFSERAEPIVDAICTLITAIGTAWAMYARLFLPTPPLTDEALLRTQERLRDGGFASVHMLAVIATTLVVALLLAGCQAAQPKPSDVLAKACAPVDQYQIERCAEAVGDVYAVYLERAATIASDPTTPADVRESIKRVDRELTPAVRLLVQAARAYVQLREAQAPPEEVSAAEAKLKAQLSDVEPRVRSLPQL